MQRRKQKQTRESAKTAKCRGKNRLTKKSRQSKEGREESNRTHLTRPRGRESNSTITASIKAPQQTEKTTERKSEPKERERAKGHSQ